MRGYAFLNSNSEGACQKQLWKTPSVASQANFIIALDVHTTWNFTPCQRVSRREHP